jgi:hypothetical protein
LYEQKKRMKDIKPGAAAEAETVAQVSIFENSCNDIRIQVKIVLAARELEMKVTHDQMADLFKHCQDLVSKDLLKKKVVSKYEAICNQLIIAKVQKDEEVTEGPQCDHLKAGEFILKIIGWKDPSKTPLHGVSGELSSLLRSFRNVQPATEEEANKPRCECGNVYMYDSAYCRKCGKERLQADDETSLHVDHIPSTVADRMAKSMGHAGQHHGQGLSPSPSGRLSSE